MYTYLKLLMNTLFGALFRPLGLLLVLLNVVNEIKAENNEKHARSHGTTIAMWTVKLELGFPHASGRFSMRSAELVFNILWFNTESTQKRKASFATKPMQTEIDREPVYLLYLLPPSSPFSFRSLFRPSVYFDRRLKKRWIS